MNDREEQMGEVIVTMKARNKFKALLLHLRLFEKFLEPTLIEYF
jgi:hypothetical protein